MLCTTATNTSNTIRTCGTDTTRCCRASTRRRATSGRSAWRCGRSCRTPATARSRTCPTPTSSPTSSACAPPPEVTSRRKMAAAAGGRTRGGRKAVRARRTTWWRPAGAVTPSADRRSARPTCSYSASTPATAPCRSREERRKIKKKKDEEKGGISYRQQGSLIGSWTLSRVAVNRPVARS